jgi:phage tail sheath gpL-like
MAQQQIVQLPAGLKLPGVYTTVILNSDGGVAAPNSRVLIWAYMGAGGTATPNVPFQAFSKSQVDAAVRSWSMASHAYAAAKSALPEGIGAEFYIVPMLEPSGGTAQTKKVKFLAAPSAGVTGTATAAAAADTCTITYRGRGGSFAVKVSDNWATIATNAQTMLNAISDFPATISISTDTLTLTARHKGAFDDGALQVDFANAASSGCAASPGTLTFSGTAGVGGTCTLNLGVGLTSFAVTAADTAIVSAGNAVTAIRADAYQNDAAQPGTPDGSVTLYYITGRPCRPITATLGGGVTVQTLTVSCDTVGTGTPAAQVASALNKLNSDENAYKCWSVFFPDSTSLSSVVSTVEAQNAVGTLEKTQMVFLVTTGNLTSLVSANIPASTTPAMTSSAAYAIGFYQGHPNAGWEIAARCAAVVAAQPYVAKNYNGTRLPTNAAVPFGVPHKADRASRDDLNTATAQYNHFPLAVDSGGYNAIVRSNNTYRSQGYNDQAMQKWSCFLTCGFFRADLAADLKLAFGDKSIKTLSDPRTTNTVKPLGVKARVYERIDRWDNLDLFDGAAAVRDAIMAGTFVSPNRIDIQAPFRTVKDIDQIVVAGIQE